MKSRKARIILIAAASLTGVLLIAVISALIALRIRTDAVRDGWSSVLADEKYAAPVSVEGVKVIEQEISCGYAVIEMFSSWNGGDITEESLYDEYGSVVTSTGGSFAEEMNRRFPEYKTEIHRYLKNSELLSLVYEQLSYGVPVPFEWAAPLGDEWTLHYSLVTGMDIQGDKITVANPYGYMEEISVDEFLSRTSFDAYENMPLFLKLGFAFGIFEKNTVFTVRKGEETEEMTDETEDYPDIEIIRPSCVLVIEANGTIFYAHFEDNSSAEAFKEKLNSETLTVNMRDYGGFEKVADLPWELPRNDSRITTEPGDIILYQGNQITIYYGENTWDFTRLAKIGNISGEQLLSALGDGDVSVKFSLEWGE